MSGKREVRNALLHERRAYLNEKRLKGSRQIMQNLADSDLYKNCRTLMCFISTRIEVDTSKIIERAFADGKRVAAPRCVPQTSSMDFYYINSLDDLETLSFNLLEPMEHCELVSDHSSSLCIVPGLAYSRQGHRIGFGSGYYDRFLADYNGISCGVIFDEFIRDDLPTEDTDVKVKYIMTETGIIEISNT